MESTRVNPSSLYVMTTNSHLASSAESLVAHQPMATVDFIKYLTWTFKVKQREPDELELCQSTTVKEESQLITTEHHNVPPDRETASDMHCQGPSETLSTAAKLSSSNTNKEPKNLTSKRDLRGRTKGKLDTSNPPKTPLRKTGTISENSKYTKKVPSTSITKSRTHGTLKKNTMPQENCAQTVTKTCTKNECTQKDHTHLANLNTNDAEQQGGPSSSQASSMTMRTMVKSPSCPITDIGPPSDVTPSLSQSGSLQSFPHQDVQLLSGQQHILSLGPEQWHEFLAEKATSVTEEQKAEVRKHYQHFIQYIDINDVIDYMHQDGIFNDEELQEFRVCTTKQESMRKMMSAINLRGQKAYYSFARAHWFSMPHSKVSLQHLQPQPEQQFRIQDLEGKPCSSLMPAFQERPIVQYGSKYSNLQLLVQSEVDMTPQLLENAIMWYKFLLHQSRELSPRNAKMMQHNYVILTQNMKPEDVLLHLIIDNVISDEQRQEVLNQRSRQASNRELLSIVRRKGDIGYYSLLHALTQTMHEEHVTEWQSYVSALKSSHIEDIQEEVGATRLGDIREYTNLCIQSEQDVRKEYRRSYNLLHVETSGISEDRINPEEIFHALRRQYKPTSVLIAGQAGMGKSTLIRKVVHDWSENKIWGQNFQYVYRFQLRFLNSLEKASCFDLLMKHHSPNLPIKLKKKIWKMICSNPATTLLIFDGLDEFRGFDHMEEDHKVPKVYDNDMEVTLDVLLTNLLEKNLLGKATVLFTSRPRAKALDFMKNFKRNIYIAGFSDAQINRFVKTASKGDADLEAWTLTFLDNSPDIRSYCYIPVFTSLICSCAKQIRLLTEMKDMEWDHSPRTITQLMTLVTIVFIMDHHPRYKNSDLRTTKNVLQPLKEPFRNLANLAAYGLMSNPVRLAFSTKDTEEISIKITHDEIDLGLLSASRGSPHPIFGTKEDIWSFIHLLLQEYMASLHVLSLPWPKVKAIFTRPEGTRQHDMLRMFLVGILADQQLHQILQDVFPHPETTQYAKGMVIGLLRILERSSISRTREGRLLLVMTLYQTQRADVVQAMEHWAINENGDLNMEDCHITPVETKAIAFFFKNTNISLRCLTLNTNPLGDSGIKILCEGLLWQANSVEELNLNNTDLSNCGMAYLAELLKKTTRLRALNVGRNPFGAEGFQMLCESLQMKTIERLRLKDLQIGDAGLKILAEALVGTKRLRALGLSHNHIGPEGLSALGSRPWLKTLKQLYLDGNTEIGDKGAEILTDTVLPHCKQLQTLWLYHSALTETGALSVAKALKDHCSNLSEKGFELIPETLSNDCKDELVQILGRKVIFLDGTAGR